MSVRLALILLAAGFAAAAPNDAESIVRRSLDVDEQNSQRLLEYGYSERVRKIDLDKHGEPKKTDVKAFLVEIVEGSAYKRLISRFDKPLEPAEEESEKLRFEEVLAERRAESESQREQRIREFEERSEKNREALREIPDAFHLKVVGEERVNGRPAWVIEATPRRGYRPKSWRSRLFTGVYGKLWIDQETYQWARVEAELAESVSLGWFLIRLSKGARTEIESVPVDDEVWAPRRLWYTVSYTYGLVMHERVDQESIYTNYQRAGSDHAGGVPRQALTSEAAGR